MEVHSADRFDALCGKTYAPSYDLSFYVGKEFDCACGARHSFDPRETVVVREHAGGRLVLGCPDRMHLTCVKIKGFFNLRFISLFGSELPTSEEVANEIPLIGDKGPGPNTGYNPVLSDDVRNRQTGLPQKISTSTEKGPDGNMYWITVILRYADDLETIEPIMSFIRRTESEAREVHTVVATVAAQLDFTEWGEALPIAVPDDLIEQSDALGDLLKTLGNKLISK